MTEALARGTAFLSGRAQAGGLLISAPAAVRVLEVASLAYIGLPFLIFCFGWLRMVVALPLALLYLAGLAECAWRAWRAAAHAPDAEGIPRQYFLLRTFDLVALIAFVVACTGIGALSVQFFDYAWYNALMRDMISAPWPLGYQEAGPNNEPLFMNFYYGYFLPAALVGKLLGWNAAIHFFYLWGVIGVLLTVLWFRRLTGLPYPWFALFFLFFGGMDFLGQLLTAQRPPYEGLTWWDFLTGTYWWSTSRGWMDHWTANLALPGSGVENIMNGVFYRFYSPISFLVDGPYHVLPGWIVVQMILHDLMKRRTLERAALLWCGLPLLSVFVPLGCAPFIALGLLELFRGGSWRSFGNCVTAPAVTLLFFLYYVSVESGGRVSGFLWQYQNLLAAAPYLLLYYLAEFGLMALVLPTLRAPGMPDRRWWYLALALLLAAPWYRMGEYNDFTTKVTIPAQIVFMVYLALGIMAQPQNRLQRIKRGLLMVFLCIGAIGPLGNLIRAIEYGFHPEPMPMARSRHINEVEPRRLLLQGKGRPDSLFWKYLAAPVPYMPSEKINPHRVWDLARPKADEKWEYFTEERALSPEGLRIRVQGDTPILRLRDISIDAARVGTIFVDHTVLCDGVPTAGYRLIFLWVPKDELRRVERGRWPFHRWRSNVLVPLRDSVSTNPWWRGTIGDFALFLDLPDDRTGPCEILIRSIQMLER